MSREYVFSTKPHIFTKCEIRDLIQLYSSNNEIKKFQDINEAIRYYRGILNYISHDEMETYQRENGTVVLANIACSIEKDFPEFKNSTEFFIPWSSLKLIHRIFLPDLTSSSHGISGLMYLTPRELPSAKVKNFIINQIKKLSRFFTKYLEGDLSKYSSLSTEEKDALNKEIRDCNIKITATAKSFFYLPIMNAIFKNCDDNIIDYFSNFKEIDFSLFHNRYEFVRKISFLGEIFSKIDSKIVSILKKYNLNREAIDLVTKIRLGLSHQEHEFSTDRSADEKAKEGQKFVTTLLTDSSGEEIKKLQAQIDIFVQNLKTLKEKISVSLDTSSDLEKLEELIEFGLSEKKKSETTQSEKDEKKSKTTQAKKDKEEPPIKLVLALKQSYMKKAPDSEIHKKLFEIIVLKDGTKKAIGKLVKKEEKEGARLHKDTFKAYCLFLSIFSEKEIRKEIRKEIYKSVIKNSIDKFKSLVSSGNRSYDDDILSFIKLLHSKPEIFNDFSDDLSNFIDSNHDKFSMVAKTNSQQYSTNKFNVKKLIEGFNTCAAELKMIHDEIEDNNKGINSRDHLTLVKLIKYREVLELLKANGITPYERVIIKSDMHKFSVLMLNEDFKRKIDEFSENISGLEELSDGIIVDEEGASKKYTSTLHSLREILQIKIGSYARILIQELKEDVCEREIIGSLETLASARAYLAHSTLPHLGEGQLNAHSADVFQYGIPIALKVSGKLASIALKAPDTSSTSSASGAGGRDGTGAGPGSSMRACLDQLKKSLYFEHEDVHSPASVADWSDGPMHYLSNMFLDQYFALPLSITPRTADGSGDDDTLSEEIEEEADTEACGAGAGAGAHNGTGQGPDVSSKHPRKSDDSAIGDDDSHQSKRARTLTDKQIKENIEATRFEIPVSRSKKEEPKAGGSEMQSPEALGEEVSETSRVHEASQFGDVDVIGGTGE